MEVLGFYKENDLFGEFSNFYRCNFQVDGIWYVHSEQYIMHQKALLFGDQETAGRIMNERSPMVCKHLGRQVKNFDTNTWYMNLEAIAFKGLYAKFSQNVRLKDRLLSTGDMIIAECSPHDAIWGVGMSVTDINVYYPERWRGKNLLGRYLMMVREALKEESKSEC